MPHTLIMFLESIGRRGRLGHQTKINRAIGVEDHYLNLLFAPDLLMTIVLVVPLKELEKIFSHDTSKDLVLNPTQLGELLQYLVPAFA